MNSVIALILCLMAPLAYANKPAAPPPTLNDFAWHQALSFSAQASAYRIELPAAVYIGSRRADLGDVRIFNGNGELLPYAHLPEPRLPEQTPTRLRVPYFAIHASNGNDGAGLSLHLQANKDGQLKSLRVDPRAKASASAISSYILDASAVKQPMIGVKLAWSAPSGDNVVAINVEASDNLQDWRQVRTAAQLVNLRRGEEQLQRDSVEFGGVRAKYLRISWNTPQHAIMLTKAEVEISANAALRASQQWHNVVVSASETPGEYLFDTEGLPTESLRIALPQSNTVAPWRLYHRASTQHAWRQAGYGTAYRLTENGQEITSADIPLLRSRDRYWRLLVDQRGGGLGAGLPAIAVGWTPQQLIFVARGSPPFRLAYGNADIGAAGYPAGTLLPEFRPEQAFNLPVARVEQSQAAAPSPAPDPARHNKWILWGVILLGTIVLGIMVWRLLRQMSAPPT